MEIRDKDEAQPFGSGEWVMLGLFVFFTHLGYLALWFGYITVGPMGKLAHQTTTHEGAGALFMSGVFIAAGCYFLHNFFNLRDTLFVKRVIFESGICSAVVLIGYVIYRIGHGA